MKYLHRLIYASLTLFAFSLFAPTWAYTPSEQDQELLAQVATMLDENLETLGARYVKTYHKLDSAILKFHHLGNEQVVYVLREVQKILHTKLFNAQDVCIKGYAQRGDTVGVTYTVQDSRLAIINKRTKELVFNPGLQKIWLSLNEGVMGMQQGQRELVTIPSYPVLAEDDEGGKIISAREMGGDDAAIEVGDIYVFGSTKAHGVVLGEVVAIDGEDVEIDFGISGPGHDVYLTINLKSLKKSCAYRKSSDSL